MKNLFGYYLKSCREEKHLSLRDFGALCHLSHTHIDSLEKGKDFRTGKKVSPTPETIEKIANGLMLREQMLFNLSLEKVNFKFNCFLSHKEREEVKSTARNILNNPQLKKELSMEQLIKYQEDIFVAFFSRSVEASDFDIEHVDLNTYIAMLLHQEQIKSKIEENLYEALVNKYGTLKGLPENTTQYIITKRTLIEPKITEDVVTFPVIGEVAAGYESIADENWEGDVVDVPLSYLHGRSKSDFFVLRVKGDSMYPLYREGDRVLILKQSTMNYSGQIGVVMYDDDKGTLKKIEYVQGEDWMKLIPLNPNHKIIEIKDENLEHCRVLGIPQVLIRENCEQMVENYFYTMAENTSILEKYNLLNSIGKSRADAYLDGLLDTPSYSNGSTKVAAEAPVSIEPKIKKKRHT